MNSTDSKPRRNRLRLTLGAMMIVVLGIGCVLGWIVHRANVQRDAVAAITRPSPDHRGSVNYDWQYVAGKFDKNAKPRGPKWLRDVLGPDVFDTVVFVGLQGNVIDDELLLNLGKLDKVERINIQGHAAPGLTNAAMASLRPLSRLKWLTVQGFSDSTGFVAGLEGKTRLQHLWLQSATVSDVDMAMIGRFTDLDSLCVDGRNVTDRGFTHVVNLKKLTLLEMPGVDITSLAPVANLVQLDRLTLNLRPIRPDSAGLAPRSEGPTSLDPLRRLTKLRDLQLGTTRIEDRELAVVAGLPKLLGFMIGGRRITDDGLARIASSGSLHSLWLLKTSIADLRPLSPRLRAIGLLMVKDSRLTDDGIEPLSRATQIRVLMIPRSNITDVGLEHLVPLTSLVNLQLDRNAITDSGLARLKHLGRLTVLSLEETKLTDASVPTLSGFQSLQSLYLYRSGISPAGIDQLQKALPKTRISLLKRPDL